MTEATATLDGQAPAATAQPSPKNIGEAKLEIMKRVPYLLKRKPDPKQDRGIKYTFAAEPDLIHVLRPVMIEFGVDMRPGKVRIENQEQYQTNSGGNWNRVRIIQEFIFRHVPSQTEDVCELVGEGADPGDKTSGKAHTGAYKYALREYFMVETGDDPDRFASEEQQQKRKPSGFEIAKQAIRTAKTVKRLNILRDAYFQRGYTDGQIEELERLYWDVAGSLGAEVPPGRQREQDPEGDTGYGDGSG
jgi:hypothetical protein